MEQTDTTETVDSGRADERQGPWRRLLGFSKRVWRRSLGFSKRVLEGRKVYVLVAALALLLTSKALTGVFGTDDFLFLAAAQGFPGLPEYTNGPLDTFTFSGQDLEHNKMLIERGVFPWWALPEGKLSFWRPITSFSHWMDYQLWGFNPRPMYAHTMLWYALCAVLVTVLYRRVIDVPWIAGLAGVLFAIDNMHAGPVGWLASRNALMALAFSLGVLIVHDRWRRDRWMPGAVVGPVLLAIGLGCGEAALAVCGYLFAYAVFVDRAKWTGKMGTLVPYATVAIVYLLVYRGMGCGTTGSGWYTDPVTRPVEFLGNVVARLPLLVFSQIIEWLGFVLFLPWWLRATILVGFPLAVFGVAWPMLKQRPETRFWVVGMLLALLLPCSLPSQPRLLVMAGIGGIGFVAQFLGGLRAREPWVAQVRRVPTKIIAVLLVLTHCIIAPIYLFLITDGTSNQGRPLAASFATIPSEPEVVEQDLVILQFPHDFVSWYFAIARSARSEPIPKHVRMLSAGFSPMEVERVDDRSFVLRPEKGFVATPQVSPYRGSDYPMQEGEVVELDGMTVTVRAVSDYGMPTEALFQFDKPLNDPSLVWLTAIMEMDEVEGYAARFWIAKYIPIEMPPPGETATIQELVAQAGRTHPADLKR